MPLLHDLAEVDSAAPLEGPALVAVVEGRIWAALALDGDRVIADPFLPTAPAVELLRLRVAQLRASERRAAAYARCRAGSPAARGRDNCIDEGVSSRVCRRLGRGSRRGPGRVGARVGA